MGLHTRGEIVSELKDTKRTIQKEEHRKMRIKKIRTSGSFVTISIILIKCKTITQKMGSRNRTIIL